MKRFSKAAALALFAFTVVRPAHASPPEAPVAVEVQGVSPEDARAIKRKASQGKTALIEYLERRHFIYEVKVEQAPQDASAAEQPIVIANTNTDTDTR